LQTAFTEQAYGWLCEVAERKASLKTNPFQSQLDSKLECGFKLNVLSTKNLAVAKIIMPEDTNLILRTTRICQQAELTSLIISLNAKSLQ